MKYHQPSSPTAELKKKKVSSLVNKEFLCNEGFEKEPITLVTIGDDKNNPQAKQDLLNWALKRTGLKNYLFFC